jgi:hypothetical protein
MDIVLDRKELTKYPFLKESQQLASQHVESLEAFLASSAGNVALERAKERIIAALRFRRDFQDDAARGPAPELEIASYALARIIVSCIGDRSLSTALHATNLTGHHSSWQPKNPRCVVLLPCGSRSTPTPEACR